MTKKRLNILLYAIILVIGITVFCMCNELQVQNSKILPYVVTSLMMGLAALGIVQELFWKNDAQEERQEDLEENTNTASSWRSSEFFWLLPLAALAAGCIVFGFYVASFLFVAAYIRLNGGSIKEAAIFAICTPVVLYVLFYVLLGLELATGTLWELIF